MKEVLDYLEARVEALTKHLELQLQINEVEGKVPIDPVRAVHLIQHLNKNYGVPMTHIADRLGVTREWLRQNLNDKKITKPMQNKIQSMIEDMVSDLQLVLVEELI